MVISWLAIIKPTRFFSFPHPTAPSHSLTHVIVIVVVTAVKEALSGRVAAFRAMLIGVVVFGTLAIVDLRSRCHCLSI